MKCGVGDYTAILAERLSALPGMEIGVLTSSKASDRACVHLIRPTSDWGWGDLNRIMGVVKSFRPDLVHIQYPTLGYDRNLMPFWLPFVIRLIGIRVVQTWHEPLRWRSLYWYLPAVLMKGGLVVVEPDFSDLTAAWVRPFLALKQISFIPVGSSIPRVILEPHERTAVRSRFCGEGERLIAYFGFASPSKRIELLLDITDPVRDRLVFLCDLNENDEYQKMILDKIRAGAWRDRTIVTGFLPPTDVGSILAVADAAVFPFANGVAFRNTSFLAARTQGLFVLTTSFTKNGYAAEEHVYYAAPGNIDEMRQALFDYAGKEPPGNISLPVDWDFIADEHIRLYQAVLNRVG